MKDRQIPERLQSRKFWVAIVTTLVMLINALTPIDLDLEAVLGVIVPAGLYLLGQSYVDARKPPTPPPFIPPPLLIDRPPQRGVETPEG